MRDICSWHVVLHPVDARVVVQKGWGEFHPLAGFAGSEAGFVMIYGPRNTEEVDALIRILFAALEYAKERDAAAPVISGRVSSLQGLNFESSKETPPNSAVRS